MIKVKDSRGNSSSVLGFVTLAFLIGTVAFIYTVFKSDVMDLTAYGLFTTTVLAPFVAREYTEKVKKNV